MIKIFITATNTDIGKTYTSVKLIESLNKKKIKTLGCKPIETGVKGIEEDASRLLKASQSCEDFLDLKIPSINFYSFKLPASPIVAKENCEILPLKILENCEKLSKICDVLIIEGAGGIYVPIEKDYFMLNLIQDLKCDGVILVGGSRLGCINDMLLSYNTLICNKIEPINVFNVLDDSFYEISYKFLESYFVESYILQKDFTKLENKILSLL